MRLPISPLRRVAGGTLLAVVCLGLIMGITIGGMLSLSGFSLRNAHGHADRSAAFFHAENALQWAAQNIADTDPSVSNFFATAHSSLPLPYMADRLDDAASGFKNAWVSVVRTNPALRNVYLVTASAKVKEKVRTVQAVVVKNPPSNIFDYEYFLNNWGWWWGGGIAGEGANRSNWDFDFRGRPTVNGYVLANGRVSIDGVAYTNQATANLGGLAGNNPQTYIHPGASRVPMPNLKEFTYYNNKALQDPAQNGIWIGGSQIVAGVHNNAKPGLYLNGTAASPIVIKGTAVVPGDVIIKGKISGKGTLYVGGNLYIAGDTTYHNGPNWSVAPETMNDAQRDAWVNSNTNKDIVGFAVRGTILAGDVNSSEWKSRCFDAATYGLKNVGDESRLGLDGIENTGDDNLPFEHPNGSYSTWYDADEDSLVDANYNYYSDLAMSSNRVAQIAGYPTNNLGKPVTYSGGVSTNNMNSLDGIFYTNHAIAMRLAKNNALFHGTIICRDEAIIFNSSLRFVYDSRIHSRYGKDPNKYVDLGLPFSVPLRINSFAELPPNTSHL